MNKENVTLVDKKDLELFAKKIEALEAAVANAKEAFKLVSGSVKLERKERKKRTPKVATEATATEVEAAPVEAAPVEAPVAEVKAAPAVPKAAAPKTAPKALVIAKTPPPAAKANGKGMPTLPGKH